MSDLLRLTAELVAIPSLSHHEEAVADRVADALSGCAWLRVERIGDNVLARTELGRRRRLLVAGHLDTVPPASGAGPRLDGDVVWGVGAADMKGGLAVMLDLATAVPEPAVDVTWCFYACEEVARAESGLVPLWAERPELLAADVAILGEPTDGVVEAGCQGTLRLAVRLGGVRAHTARPFTGCNAVHRLGPVLDAVAGWPGRRVVLDGCEYVEQLQAVAVDGGVAGNVVPDRATLTLNYRYAPDRRGAEARRAVEEVLDGAVGGRPDDGIEWLDQADGAPPSLDHPLLAALVAATGRPPRAKVGWTDVASFWSHGIPAANFGPGDPLLAHHPDERVDRAALDRARQVLGTLLTGGAA
ncbi:MAG: succinyl-diaminopimelate desuccinylase [Acidimicrobiales bacterium]